MLDSKKTKHNIYSCERICFIKKTNYKTLSENFELTIYQLSIVHNKI